MGIKVCMSERSNLFRNFIKFICITLSIYFVIYGSVPAFAVESEKDVSKNENYTLTLKEFGGNEEKIYGSQINLKYDTENSKIISYDENLLNECIEKLSCLDESKLIDGTNAMIKYGDGGYNIIKEVSGNKVNKEILVSSIKNAVINNIDTLDLTSAGCYEKPRFVENSPLVYYAKETLNKYVSSSITYKFAGATQVISAPTIKDWVCIDDNFNPIINENKVKDCLYELAASYNSMAEAEKNIQTENDGSHYIWAIDVDTEATRLTNNIKNGDVVIKEPAYKKVKVVIPEKPVVSESSSSYGKSTVSGVGNTYVAINLTTQHLWFYKNGSLIVDGNIVTGNVSTGCATPTGTYKLYYKQRDTVLRGPGYASPVKFWMPFNGGIGLHDASWRSTFGGSIYKTNGSHGCINLPYSVAKKIYDNINAGDYIVVYK